MLFHMAEKPALSTCTYAYGRMHPRFGPQHTFWCFGFECMNGWHGTIPPNKHAVEVQLMRKFVDGMCLHGFVRLKDEDVQVLLRMMAKSSKCRTLSFIDPGCYVRGCATYCFCSCTEICWPPATCLWLQSSYHYEPQFHYFPYCCRACTAKYDMPRCFW